MDKTKIKNFVFDLDGTLLSSGKYFTQRTLNALNMLSNKNKNIIVATGRAHYLNLQIEKLIKLNYPLISSNGGLIYDFKTKKIIKKYNLEKNLAKTIFDSLIENKIDFLIYTTDTLVINIINEDISWYKRYKTDKPKNDPTYNSKPGINAATIKEKINEFEIIKFLVFTYYLDNKKIEQLTKKIMSFSKDIYIVSSEGGMLDIMLNGATKGKALEFIANTYGFSLEETIVFGDADNDISMFEKAKYSVAMGNAVSKLKEIANYITSDNDNDGVAKFLEDNFL